MADSLHPLNQTLNAMTLNLAAAAAAAERLAKQRSSSSLDLRNLDGPSIDRLANLILRRARHAPGT